MIYPQWHTKNGNVLYQPSTSPPPPTSTPTYPTYFGPMIIPTLSPAPHTTPHSYNPPNSVTKTNPTNNTAIIATSSPSKTSGSRGASATSKNRTKEQKTNAVKEARRLLRLTPPNAIIIYCDGSANPNPGPSGSGVVVIIPTNDGPLTLTSYRDLGFGTNNTGELWGPLQGLWLTITTCHSLNLDSAGPIFIYSDSTITINAIMYHSLPTTNKMLLYALRDLLFDIPNYIVALWVAGHASIEENELADDRAKAGSSASEHSALSPLPSIKGNGFSYNSDLSSINGPDYALTAIQDSLEHYERHMADSTDSATEAKEAEATEAEAHEAEEADGATPSHPSSLPSSHLSTSSSSSSSSPSPSSSSSSSSHPSFPSSSSSPSSTSSFSASCCQPPIIPAPGPQPPTRHDHYTILREKHPNANTHTLWEQALVAGIRLDGPRATRNRPNG
jgi:ribonuclease HI